MLLASNLQIYVDVTSFQFTTDVTLFTTDVTLFSTDVTLFTLLLPKF